MREMLIVLAILSVNQLFGNNEVLRDSAYVLIDRHKDFSAAKELIDQVTDPGLQNAMMGYWHFSQNQPGTALGYYELSLAFIQDNPLRLYSVTREQGRCYYEIFLFEESRQKYYEALELINNIPYKRQASERYKLYWNLGLVNKKWNKLGDAAASFLKALDYSSSDFHKIEVYNQISIVLQYDSSFKESRKYAELVLDLNPNNYYRAAALHNLGFAKNKIDGTGIEEFHASLSLKEGSHRFVTLMDLGEIEQNESLLLEAESFMPNLPEPKQYNLYDILYEFYYEKEIFKNTGKYHRLYVDAHDAYTAYTKDQMIKYRQTVAKNIVANVQKQKEIQILEARNKKKLWSAIGISVAALLIVTLWIALKNRGRIKEVQQIDSDLEEIKI